MHDLTLAASCGLTLALLLGGCGARGGAPAATRGVSEPTRGTEAADLRAPAVAEPPLGPSVELECGAWTSRLPAGATFSGSSCDDDNGGDIDPTTRVGVLGGASSYDVELEGCEIFVEIAGGGRPTPSATPAAATDGARTALPRSRFGFALSRLTDTSDRAAVIAVESTQHPELGVRARVSPVVPEAERARCGLVRDRIASTLANEAEWRGALRPADGRVVLHIGSETQRMELQLPEGYVARSTGMAVDVYQTHHVIQRWPPPPMAAVDDGWFGAHELEVRLALEDGPALDTASPRLEIVTGYAGGFVARHAPRGTAMQVGARRLTFGRLLDDETMPNCTTASDASARGAGFVISYFLCGGADPALTEVLRSVRLVDVPSASQVSAADRSR